MREGWLYLAAAVVSAAVVIGVVRRIGREGENDECRMPNAE
jgi:hypothetical protein